MTPTTRLRGQLDDDELLGFSVDQRPGQPNQVQKILSPACNVVYKECQKNQALDSAAHCVDGCGEFMRRGNTKINLPKFIIMDPLIEWIAVQLISVLIHIN